MASPDEILTILQDLVNAYPGKQMTDANFKIYVEHLSDIHPVLLRRAADNLIANSSWFPRVAEIRAEAARLVGSRMFSSWEPSVNTLRAQYFELQRDFYHHRKLDPDAWDDLATQFDRRDLIYSAQDTRRRYKIFQKILIEESIP